MPEIRLAIAGVGNCASAFIQGLYYYKSNDDISGLIYPDMGGYKPGDIKVVAAFDVNEKKVGKDLSEAIYAEPNCTIKFYDVPYMNVPVMMGPVLDGVPEHLKKFVSVSNKPSVDVVKVLKDTSADVIINIIPTGSALATRAYADAAIKEARVAFIYKADESETIESVVFNGWIETIDNKTGKNITCCILSLQTTRERFL